MLMPVKTTDFHHIDPEHRGIDERLTNWADYVRVKHPSWVSPIWKLGKSNGRQWAQPEFRQACDLIDGQKIEEAVRELPNLHRSAIRWAYVFRGGALNFRRKHRLTEDGLAQILKDGRRMLMNRHI